MHLHVDKKHLIIYCELCLILFSLYLRLREEGAGELPQVTRGIHGLLKLTSDVVLARTRNSLMGSRQQEMYSDFNTLIFEVTCLGKISFHVVV